MNKIIIIGRLGKDPELRYTQQGDAVCSMSVATSEKVKGEQVTTWFRVTFWRKAAEILAKYLTKGSQVYIEGRLSLEEYTDKQGQLRQSLSVAGTDFHFVGGNSGEGKTQADDDFAF